VILGAIWEIIEYHLHIEEYFTNRVFDVMIALIGAYGMFVVFARTSPKLLLEIGIVVLIAVVWALFGYDGFPHKRDT
jgi:hypothetical protein